MKKSAVILTVFCVLPLTTTACRPPEISENQGRKPLPVMDVRLAGATVASVTHPHEVVGTVAAAERATLAARLTGVITALPVTLGSVVEKGQVVARIGADEIRARLSRAAAERDLAGRNLERAKRLLARGAATPAAVEDLEDAHRVAAAGYREAEALVGYIEVSAPFAGVVSRKLANAGDLAVPGLPLLEIENSGKLQVVAAVPESMLDRLRPEMVLPVRVPVAGFSGNGAIVEIAPATEAASRTATVKIAIAGGQTLRPGQLARVILPASAADTLVVPRAAVIPFGQMEKIFVAEKGVARLRLVRTGEQHGERVEILTGLDGGEQVVIEGGEKLNDGQPIRVLP
ncbi:MAG: efflux RND transporter periplasmic adaptor subunit [Thermodesulfobacteriota bacterium]